MSLESLYVLPGELSDQFFCPFFKIELFVFLEWRNVSSLYSLVIKPLSEVSLEDMFSHMVGSHSILLMFSFAMQKLCIFMKSYLFFFFSLSHLL